MAFDQQKHPELQPGERWITNTHTEDQSLTKELKTLRKGKTAYGAYNQIIENMCPLFVQEDELREFQAKLRSELTAEQILNDEPRKYGWILLCELNN